jgi:hypothetical protein
LNIGLRNRINPANSFTPGKRRLTFNWPIGKYYTSDLARDMLRILMTDNRKILILNDMDNIAVCLVDMEVGEVIRQDALNLTIQNRIPRGHKVATKAIAKDEGIIKYGERMGHATSEIKIGEHVHTHNVLGDRLSTEQVK